MVGHLFQNYDTIYARFFPRILAIIPATRYTCVFFATYTCVPSCFVAGTDPGFFLEGGALVSCSTSTPINHIVFFLQNTSCIRKPQVISGGGGGGTHPLHPPPRSAPVWGFYSQVYDHFLTNAHIYAHKKVHIYALQTSMCV